jgi:anti-sigma-K factor RskA
LLPAYVLGALDPNEMLAIDRYVQNDPMLLARVYELEQAASQLAHVAPSAPLPAAARERLLGRVQKDLKRPSSSADMRTTIQLPIEELNRPAHADTPTARPVPAMPPARPPERLRRDALADWRSRLQQWLAGLSRRAVLGATVAALLIGIYVGQLQIQLNRMSRELATIHSTVVTLEERAQENQQLLALLADRDVRLAGTSIAPQGASAAFYVQGDKGVLVVRGLEALPATQTYQFWLVIDGTPTPFGVFQAQPNQPTLLSVALPQSAQGFAIADVSIEPAGGSQQITKETVVLRGSVS